MANPKPAPQLWMSGFYQKSPLYAPLLEAAPDLVQRADWPDLAALNAAIPAGVCTDSGQKLCFVPQSLRVPGIEEGYEMRIYRLGEVQTRLCNWHDYFNALVWLAFPLAKAALNARHHEALQNPAMGLARCRVRDYLTLFDESGVVVLYADPELAEMMVCHEWKSLFWGHREKVESGMRFVVFGHSLFEKALNPYIGLTGKALLLQVPREFMTLPGGEFYRQLDKLLREKFVPGTPVATLAPLPLLGVPGWHAANRQGEFYDNSTYFRPARSLSGRAGAVNH